MNWLSLAVIYIYVLLDYSTVVVNVVVISIGSVVKWISLSLQVTPL